MLVVADSSPLIVLTNIGHVDILPRMFGQVIIPPQVVAELRQPKRPKPILDLMAHIPAWLEVRAPLATEVIPLLHDGETAAINLARELHADLLLIDEVQGRNVAKQRNIPLTGTIGVLELAAKSKLLDLKEAFDRVKQTDFWISHELLDARLKLYQR